MVLVGSTKEGLNNPFTNMTMELDILKGVIVDDKLRFKVAVVGVRSCFVSMLTVSLFFGNGKYTFA